MNAEKGVEECYRLMYEGMVNKDEDLLEEVLDPSFVLIHMTGMRQPRPEFIRSVSEGSFMLCRRETIRLMINTISGIS